MAKVEDCPGFETFGADVKAAREAKRLCFVIRGKHPVCGEPLFCFSANPDSLSELCGFHINHRSRSFLLKVSGVSSHLSFCCTSLVSGFIIQEDAQFVYSQSAQQIRHIFASKVQISGIHEFRLSGALLHLPGQRLLATFIALFIFIGNLGRISQFSSFLERIITERNDSDFFSAASCKIRI